MRLAELHCKLHWQHSAPPGAFPSASHSLFILGDSVQLRIELQRSPRGQCKVGSKCVIVNSHDSSTVQFPHCQLSAKPLNSRAQMMESSTLFGMAVPHTHTNKAPLAISVSQSANYYCPPDSLPGKVCPENRLYTMCVRKSCPRLFSTADLCWPAINCSSCSFCQS